MTFRSVKGLTPEDREELTLAELEFRVILEMRDEVHRYSPIFPDLKARAVTAALKVADLDRASAHFSRYEILLVLDLILECGWTSELDLPLGLFDREKNVVATEKQCEYFLERIEALPKRLVYELGRDNWGFNHFCSMVEYSSVRGGFYADEPAEPPENLARAVYSRRFA